jgi:hypothetical protein
LASQSNVLGLRRVPLGQRSILAFDLGDLGDFAFILTDCLKLLFCLGTHSFVILFRTIPLGHLFDLTGIILLLPESIFDFAFAFDFLGDDRDILAGN